MAVTPALCVGVGVWVCGSSMVGVDVDVDVGVGVGVGSGVCCDVYGVPGVVVVGWVLGRLLELLLWAAHH